MWFTREKQKAMPAIMTNLSPLLRVHNHAWIMELSRESAPCSVSCETATVRPRRMRHVCAGHFFPFLLITRFQFRLDLLYDLVKNKGYNVTYDISLWLILTCRLCTKSDTSQYMRERNSSMFCPSENEIIEIIIKAHDSLLIAAFII